MLSDESIIHACKRATIKKLKHRLAFEHKGHAHAQPAQPHFRTQQENNYFRP